jgi:hypothetical protein
MIVLKVLLMPFQLSLSTYLPIKTLLTNTTISPIALYLKSRISGNFIQEVKNPIQRTGFLKPLFYATNKIDSGISAIGSTIKKGTDIIGNNLYNISTTDFAKGLSNVPIMTTIKKGKDEDEDECEDEGEEQDKEEEEDEDKEQEEEEEYKDEDEDKDKDEE